MENLKKYITGIICCLCAIFIMSHNASAVIQQQVEFVDSYTGQTIQGFGYAPNTGPMNCNYNCTVSTNGNTDIMSVINTITFNIPAQNYYTDGIIEYSFTIHKVNNSQSLHDFIAGWNVSDNNFKLMSVEIENQDTNAFSVHLYLKVIANGYASYFVLTSQNTSTYLLALQPGGRIAVSGMSLWRVVSPETNQNIINAINSQPNYSSALNDINSNIQDVTDAIEQQQEQEEQATQDAADDASDAADANSTNQQTSNLIGVLQNFLSAITNFSGTNCNISLAFPSYAGGNMNVNVCQNKDKAGNIIGVFTSLTLIVFYLPLALKLLSMIYNEIRSFTNG